MQKALKVEGRTTNNYRVPQAKFEAIADIIAPKWSGALPLTLIIDRGGKVLLKHQGYMEAIALRRAILKAINKK